LDQRVLEPKEDITQFVQDMFMLAVPASLATGWPSGRHNACTIGGDTRHPHIFGHFQRTPRRLQCLAHARRPERPVLRGLRLARHADNLVRLATTNGTPNRDDRSPGGMSGRLEIQPGDTLEWECEIEKHDYQYVHFANQLNQRRCASVWTYASNSRRC